MSSLHGDVLQIWWRKGDHEGKDKSNREDDNTMV